MELLQAIWEFFTNPFILTMLGIGAALSAIKRKYS